MSGPLSHIKVLDMSRVLAAPWAAQNLADLGADVIKIERPVKGDDSRAYAPPFLKDQNGKETKESAYFCAANRGKRSITVNLTKPEGQQLVRELAAQLHKRRQQPCRRQPRASATLWQTLRRRATCVLRSKSLQPLRAPRLQSTRQVRRRPAQNRAG